MQVEITASLLFVIIAGGFGTLALYYGYLGYMGGGRESKLNIYRFFFAGMICLGGFTVVDLLMVAGLVDPSLGSKPLTMEALRQFMLMLTAIFVAMAFKEMYTFFKSLELEE